MNGVSRVLLDRVVEEGEDGVQNFGLVLRSHSHDCVPCIHERHDV